ncbi:MAG: tetratricopeptide repeat protein [Longimicrobiaceae bacterium]
MLDEVRSPLGVVLWEGVRDVVLWATTAPANRPRLFGRRAHEERVAALHAVELDPDARGMLVLLAGVLDAERQPDRQAVARACRKLAFWAEERLLPRTSIWYAQAAALASPESAEHAYTVGLLCRRNADYIRAETWYRRAIGLARRRRDAQVYARAYMGLGDLFIVRNDYAKAREAFLRTFRAARRAGIRNLRAEALHNLFVVAAETNQVSDALDFAKKAFRAYPRSHSGRITLAHDVAGFWVLQGQYARALPVLEVLVRVLTHPSHRLFALSQLAWAAGGAGRLDVFAHAWVGTWQIIDDQPTLDCVTSSLLRLAYGSALLGDSERVDLASRLAIDIATKRGEEGVLVEARSLMETAEARGLTSSVRSQSVEAETDESADALAEAFVQTLAACAGTDRHLRMQC